MAAQDIIRLKEGNILSIIPFNSRRKRACTAIKLPSDNTTVRVFLKGAPEIVMDYCTSYFDANGEVQDTTDQISE